MHTNKPVNFDRLAIALAVVCALAAIGLFCLVPKKSLDTGVIYGRF